MTTDNYEQVQKELGEKLRNAREKARLTQTEMAALTGIDPNYYARIERGKANPSLEKLYRIMKALKIKSLAIH